MHKQAALEGRKKELDTRYEAAGKRYRDAENNDLYRGMQESVSGLERQSEKLRDEIERHEESLAAVKRLQMQISDLLKWTEDCFVVEERDKRYLRCLAEKEYDIEKKISVFLRFADSMEQQKQIFWSEEVHCEDYISRLNDEMDELEKKIKQLESNQMVFPEKIEKAKRLIQEELAAQGIRTDVRIFAELVQEVEDVKWRGAIETFLGRKRFYLIVEGEYCHKAMEILERKALHGVNVVITDKLPDTQVTPGSAAEMLKIPNLYARRYANYLLNGIHLCGSLDELHEYPKGGLMENGMLAKSYAVSCMEMKKTEFCLGEIP